MRPYFTTLIAVPPRTGCRPSNCISKGSICAACVWLVEKLPRVLPGVIESRLDMRGAMGSDSLGRHPSPTVADCGRRLDSLGYPPHPAQDVRSREIRRQEEHRFLISIGVAAACTGNVMTLAFALYGGAFSGIEAEYSWLFRWSSMLFALISLAWPGSLFLSRCVGRAANQDGTSGIFPIALVLLGGGIAGTINAVLDRGEIYFDSLTMLVFLLLVGRWLQRRQQHQANDVLERGFRSRPRRLAVWMESGLMKSQSRPCDAGRRRGGSRGRFDSGRWDHSRRRICS